MTKNYQYIKRFDRLSHLIFIFTRFQVINCLPVNKSLIVTTIIYAFRLTFSFELIFFFLSFYNALIYRKIPLIRPLCISSPSCQIYVPQICNPIDTPNITSPSLVYTSPSPEYRPMKFVKPTKYQV